MADPISISGTFDHSAFSIEGEFHGAPFSLQAVFDNSPFQLYGEMEASVFLVTDTPLDIITDTGDSIEIH